LEEAKREKPDPAIDVRHWRLLDGAHNETQVQSTLTILGRDHINKGGGGLRVCVGECAPSAEPLLLREAVPPKFELADTVALTPVPVPDIGLSVDAALPPPDKEGSVNV
jgi:hypothetical protein